MLLPEQDGQIQHEVKLTGCLSTNVLSPGEGPMPTHGTLLAPGLNAQIHQHFFAVRKTIYDSLLLPRPMPACVCPVLSCTNEQLFPAYAAWQASSLSACTEWDNMFNKLWNFNQEPLLMEQLWMMLVRNVQVRLDMAVDDPKGGQGLVVTEVCTPLLACSHIES